MPYGDWSYFMYVIPALLITIAADIYVRSVYRKYSSVRVESGMTGSDAARMVLSTHGVNDVVIDHVKGDLTDYFNPTDRIIRLSDNVYNGATVSAVGVAAHESGHAIQYSEDYLPVKIRSVITPVTKYGSMAAWPLVLLGVLFEFRPLAWIGVALFGAAVLFRMLTLPVEINASRRAIASLSGGILTEEELKGVKKVLTADALTYVASFAATLLTFLRILSVARGSRRR